ncbi:hypothetical protein [Parapedobacter soli]|uniref:hypothetical protein n=1 Tax=Parapedobacter soli TaxID=416955 RepID=UPI0021C63466|nr:hypothetical protein [Parapedobacter soli]
MKKFIITQLTLIVIFMPDRALTKTTKTADENCKMSSVLKSLLYSESGWVKVHVAEYLIWSMSFLPEVKEEFMKEETLFSGEFQYRIGIWRVLAQVADTPEERQTWITKIRDVYDTIDSPDRLHAIETLAKLKVPVIGSNPPLTEIDIRTISPFNIYSLWSAAYSLTIGMDFVRTQCLVWLKMCQTYDREAVIPIISYVLRYLRPFSEEDWQELLNITEEFDGATSTRASLCTTAWITAPNVNHKDLVGIKQWLMASRTDPSTLIHVLNGISERGGPGEARILSSIYASVSDSSKPGYDADTHATAAYAVLMYSSHD